jgi:hypothetical protein
MPKGAFPPTISIPILPDTFYELTATLLGMGRSSGFKMGLVY